MKVDLVLHGTGSHPVSIKKAISLHYHLSTLYLICIIEDDPAGIVKTFESAMDRRNQRVKMLTQAAHLMSVSTMLPP